jgi:hypothetical protein
VTHAMGDLMHMPHSSVILIVRTTHEHLSSPIRAAEGLPDELKTPPPGIKPPILLNLSSLTFYTPVCKTGTNETDIPRVGVEKALDTINESGHLGRILAWKP